MLHTLILLRSKISTQPNVDNLIQKEEPSPLEVVMKQMEEMRKDMLHTKNEQEKPNPYFSLESICLFPFDKYL